MDESFWVAISFVIFLYFAYKPIKKAIVASLDARIEEIKKTLAETEKLKEDAKILLDEVRDEVEDFEKRRKQILESANTSTDRLVELRTKETQLLLSRIKNSAIKTIENKKNIASAELRDEFIDTVLSTVRAYLVETKNNNVSDEEIINSFMKKK
jgi:F-type H+-transporting ATPase subunit b